MSKRSFEQFGVRLNGDFLRKIGVGIGAVTAAAALIFAVNRAEHTSAEHHKQEQAGLEQVLKPEMEGLARQTLELAKVHPEAFDTTPVKGGLKIESGQVDATTGVYRELDVVMGTDKNGAPDPSNPLFVGIEAASAPDRGPGFVDQIAYVAPGGEAFAANFRYDTQKGWSAYFSQVKTTDDQVVLESSGSLDSSDRHHYAADDQGNATNAITTAQATFDNANALLKDVAANLPK